MPAAVLAPRVPAPRVPTPRVPTPRVLVGGLLALGLLAGCSDRGGSGSDAGSPPGSPSGRSASSAASVPSSGSAGASTGSPTRGGPITLAFGGDVHFTAQLEPLAGEPGSLAELKPYLAAADLAMVNLETAITDRGSPEPKQFHFRTSPEALVRLQESGVDVVTMANNHAVDYGAAGLTDTLAAKEAGPIPVVGVGADDDEAYAPAYLQVRGTTVAVLGGTQVPDWTLAHWSASSSRGGVASAASSTRLAAAVRRARAKADVVVVYLHWGTDYTQCPNALQVRTARALADAGADVVLGSHAHQLQGGGWLGRTYVDYGLGNFVWWRRNNEVDGRSGVLTLTLTGHRVTKAAWTPMRVSPDGLPREPQDPGEQKTLLAKWDALRGCAHLAGSAPG
jgi:hypothetical protein